MRFWVLLFALWGAGLGAQTPAETAQAALDQLHAAEGQLERAKSGKARVTALTETVRAYEAGLSAVRAGLRGVTVRERELSLALAGQEAEIAELLTVLQARGRAGSPTLFLHPKGALGTARAGMLVAEMTPALNTKAEALREQLLEVSTLRQLQASAESTLLEGLNGVQEARSALAQAIADRVKLPKKFTEDPVKTALLIATAETLDAFANGLGEVSGGAQGDESRDIDALKGKLPLPVAGRVIRKAGEADAAGIKRPGVVIATRPQALLTSPAAATVRYQGGLLDFGNVIILEPRAGLLMVFAGLDVVYVSTGDVVAEAAPLGLMGGAEAAMVENLTKVENGAGNALSETLYLEVRDAGALEDPSLWFRTEKED